MVTCKLTHINLLCYSCKKVYRTSPSVNIWSSLAHLNLVAHHFADCHFLYRHIIYNAYNLVCNLYCRCVCLDHRYLIKWYWLISNFIVHVWYASRKILVVKVGTSIVSLPHHFSRLSWFVSSTFTWYIWSVFFVNWAIYFLNIYDLHVCRLLILVDELFGRPNGYKRNVTVPLI